MKRILLATTMSLFAMPVIAGVYTGRITNVAGEGLPNYFQFQMDVGDAQCPVGTWFTWYSNNGTTENVEDMYGTVVAARLTSYYMTFAPSGTSCNNNYNPAQYLHLGSS